MQEVAFLNLLHSFFFYKKAVLQFFYKKSQRGI